MSESNLLREDIKVLIELKYRPLVYLIDLSLRFLVLGLYIYYRFSSWWFVIIQFSLLLLLGLRYYFYEKKLLKKYQKLVNPIYQNLRVQISENIPSWLLGCQLLFGFIFSFWFFYNIFDNHSWYMFIVMLICSCFGAFLVILPLMLSIYFNKSKGVVSIKVIAEKKIRTINNGSKILEENVTARYPNVLLESSTENEELLELDPVDLNDVKIIKLESELKNINYRSEAWMLESVFLGGLAFSGFLTVASADFLGKETEAFRNFLKHINKYYIDCSEDYATFVNITTHFFRSDLYIVIMLLCLLSSVFFLLVLLLRLRLNKLYLNLDHILRILVVFNAKEEELFNVQFNTDLGSNQIARLEKIQHKIDIALIDAENFLIDIRPISIMMNIYRTIALLLFFIVLIISGFYFKPIIALSIFALAIFTVVFRSLETYAKIGKIRKILNRH